MLQTQNPKYDLELRTEKFSGDLILFLKTLKETTLNKPIIIQCVRSGTSIGANYCEADGAESKKRFPTQDRYLQEGGERDEVLDMHAFVAPSREKRGIEAIVEGSSRTRTHILKNHFQFEREEVRIFSNIPFSDFKAQISNAKSGSKPKAQKDASVF